MTKAQLAKLDDPSAPNLPEKMHGYGGPQAPVSTKEQRDRRLAMSAMLANGISWDGMIEAFSNAPFNITNIQTIQRLKTEVRAEWDDDEMERARYARASAIRRHHRHIQKAVDKGKYTAVAALEKNLAAIEGTDLHEEDKPIDVDSRLTDAILAELGQQDSKTVRILIERERAYIELGGRDGTVKSDAIVTKGKAYV